MHKRKVSFEYNLGRGKVRGFIMVNYKNMNRYLLKNKDNRPDKAVLLTPPLDFHCPPPPPPPHITSLKVLDPPPSQSQHLKHCIESGPLLRELNGLSHCFLILENFEL